MPFKLKEITDNLTIDKLKSLFKKQKKGDAGAQEWAESVSSEDREAQSPLRRNLNDIQIVFQEGKYTLFVKQFVVLLIVFLLVRYGAKNLTESRQDIQNKIDAWQVQEANKDDYMANKDHLLRLEPLFPDVSQKKEWLLLRLNNIFEKHKIRVTMDSNSAEDSQSAYVVGKQSVVFKEDFKDLGKLLADIENGNDFLRVSELTITKLTDKEDLGENSISISFATVFPQNKYAQSLFKDYAEQMAKIKQQSQPQAAEDAKNAASTENSNL